jgi:hypothetical protein
MPEHAFARSASELNGTGELRPAKHRLALLEGAQGPAIEWAPRAELSGGDGCLLAKRLERDAISGAANERAQLTHELSLREGIYSIAGHIIRHCCH